MIKFKTILSEIKLSNDNLYPYNRFRVLKDICYVADAPSERYASRQEIEDHIFNKFYKDDIFELIEDIDEEKKYLMFKCIKSSHPYNTTDIFNDPWDYENPFSTFHFDNYDKLVNYLQEYFVKPNYIEWI